MKAIMLATALAITGSAADAAVSFAFSGADFDGAAVSGTLTIDTDSLIANGAAAPATSYYFATDDAASTSLLPFLSLSFTTAGSDPALLSAGDVTYQYIQGDPVDGSFTLELDYQRLNLDGSLTSSVFGLSASDLFSSKSYGGVLLPDFADGTTFYFNAAGGTGDHETYDSFSAGAITFSAPVPEASTWSMLMLGFGAVGYAVRRRTHVAFAA